MMWPLNFNRIYIQLLNLAFPTNDIQHFNQYNSKDITKKIEVKTNIN